jgi:hypothetical protein
MVVFKSATKELSCDGKLVVSIYHLIGTPWIFVSIFTKPRSSQLGATESLIREFNQITWKPFEQVPGN